MNRRQESISTPLIRTSGNHEQMSSVERALTHLDSKNSQKVYEALTFIKKRVTKGVEEIVKFRRNGGIEKLLSIITKINSKFLEFVLSILNSCCLEEKSCYKVAQCDGVNIFADDVIKLLTTEMLCHRFCRLIGSLAVYDSCRILIHDRPEIIESVVGFLKEETDNEFKQAICKTIRVLSDTEEHHGAILRWQAVKSVALQLKTSVNDVIMTALKTVAHFLKRCTEECIRQLASAETIQSLVTLSSKSDNRDIASYSMSLLLRISRIANFCQYLGSNGAMELFIRTAEILMELAISKMRQNKLRSLFHTVNALCRCCRGSRNRLTMRELGGLKLLVQVLKTDQLAPIYHRVISGLACFVYYKEGLEALSHANVFEVLIQQLYRCVEPNPSENSVVQSGETGMMDDDEEEEDDDAAVDEAAGFQAGDEEMEFREEQRLEFEEINQDAVDEPDIFKDATARCFPAGEEKMNNLEKQFVEFDSIAKDAADDEVTALTSVDEKLETDAKPGTSLPRYSINSPTYQAVLQEQQSDDTDEIKPRNMWEGIELYGGFRYMSSPVTANSPFTANSPLRSSSLGSSPIREVYSPLSMSSCMSSESLSGGASPRSDDAGVDMNQGWSPCISDESRLSPVERIFDVAASSNRAYSPGCSSYDLPSNESEYPASVDAKMEAELAGKDTNNKSDSSKSVEEGNLTDEGIASIKGILSEEGVASVEGTASEENISDAKDDGLSMYYSQMFKKNRHYANMMVKYENVFEAGITPATTSEELTTKPEKRQRSVSLETLRKIQKTVAGDISLSSKSCVNLEELSSCHSLPRPNTSTKEEMSRESITAFNILLIVTRAYELGNSNKALCSRRIVQGLLDYLVRAEPPTKRASELLLQLTENHLCFELLIKNGIPSLCSDVLNPDICTDILNTKNRDSYDTSCCSNESKESEKSGKAGCVSSDEKAKMTLTQRLCLCEKLYRNLSDVAQTEDGKTVLGHILKKGSQSEKEHCAVELCHILRSDSMKKQILLKMGGLKLLIGILKNPQTNLFLPAVRWICCLAKELSVVYYPSKNKPVEEQTSVEHENTIDVPNDVSFVFENGDSISANRAEMAASSQVFAALLEGQFAEAKMSSIPVSHTSAQAFQLLIYIIRGESIANGVVRLNEPKDSISDVLLDVLRLANHYLMPSICERVGSYICQEFLNADNVEEVFSMCIALGCPLAPFQCVTYILSELPLQQCCQVLANLTTSDWGEDFLQLVTNALSERLTSLKEPVSLVCRKHQSCHICTYLS